MIALITITCCELCGWEGSAVSLHDRCEECDEVVGGTDGYCYDCECGETYESCPACGSVDLMETNE